jgi:5-formyltetrahydrofolate cyclo-ligase
MTTGTAATKAERTALRRTKRAARRAIQGRERKEAEARIVAQIHHHRVFRSARCVGTFLAFDGEPDIAPLLRLATGHRFYVPIIDANRMRFAALAARAGQRANFYGISEPREPRFLPSRLLDIVLTPLVAFDDAGVRIGVGRGYYDRCFAYLRQRQHWIRPKLLGVAFECQRAPRLAANDWDVPLWGIVTEQTLQVFD